MFTMALLSLEAALVDKVTFVVDLLHMPLEGMQINQFSI